MSGDEICQVLFYHVAVFIWGANKIRGEELHQHTTRLLTSVFNIVDISEFKERLENPISVITWDGLQRAWMTTQQVNDMWHEICFFGPMAAMFGREVQQTLMSPDPPNKIPFVDFQYSVDMGRASLSKEKVDAVWHESVDDRRDDDQVSHTSRRTRSPRKAQNYGTLREQPDHRQSTDIRNRPEYRESTYVRERHDVRRPTDVRDRSDHRHHGEQRDSVRDRRPYARSETRYDHDTKERSRRR